MKTEIKKLLLTSNDFVNPKIAQKFLKLVDKNPADIKVLFVPTASEMSNDKTYLQRKSAYFAECEKELMGLGIKKGNWFWLDIDNIPAAGDLNQYDAIYVCGGNTFYLADKFKKTGFDKKIIEFINTGKVYVGASAGSIIMGPQITSSADKNIVGLKDTSGLNLFNQCIVPHAQAKDKNMIDEFEKKNNCKVLRLNDGQALEVVGNVTNIIE